MPKAEKDKVMIAEHVLEVRHGASGTFLDLRGSIADYIRTSGFFPHWRIDANVINFQDDPNTIKTEAAFVGYKSAGYVVLNPQTHNFLTDRASSFWKLLIKNDHYKIPQPTRFGTRTMVFIPSRKSFEEINKAMFEAFLTEKARSLLGGKEIDFRITVDSKEDVYDVRVVGGPVHKEEAKRYFQFDSEHFKQCGLFLDIDYYKTDELSMDSIPKLLKRSVDLMWEKAERIATGIGL